MGSYFAAGGVSQLGGSSGSHAVPEPQPTVPTTVPEPVPTSQATTVPTSQASQPASPVTEPSPDDH